MDFIVNNWAIIIVVVIGLSAIVTTAVHFFNKNKNEQIEKVREWILYAVTIAEKELGSGTGRLKLRYVYDMFVVKFPWLARIISFECISALVDEALKEMNDLLATNSAVKNYVNNTK